MFWVLGGGTQPGIFPPFHLKSKHTSLVIRAFSDRQAVGHFIFMLTLEPGTLKLFPSEDARQAQSPQWLWRLVAGIMIV